MGTFLVFIHGLGWYGVLPILAIEYDAQTIDGVSFGGTVLHHVASSVVAVVDRAATVWNSPQLLPAHRATLVVALSVITAVPLGLCFGNVTAVLLELSYDQQQLLGAWELCLIAWFASFATEFVLEGLWGASVTKAAAVVNGSPPRLATPPPSSPLGPLARRPRCNLPPRLSKLFLPSLVYTVAMINWYSGARTALLPPLRSTNGGVVFTAWHAFWILYFHLDAKIRQLKRISLATLLRRITKTLLLWSCAAARVNLQAAWDSNMARATRSVVSWGCIRYAHFSGCMDVFGPSKVSLRVHLCLFCTFLYGSLLCGIILCKKDRRVFP